MSMEYRNTKNGKIEFKEDDARALKVYFEDFERKYNQYKALIEKLDMYKNGKMNASDLRICRYLVNTE